MPHQNDIILRATRKDDQYSRHDGECMSQTQMQKPSRYNKCLRRCLSLTFIKSLLWCMCCALNSRVKQWNLISFSFSLFIWVLCYRFHCHCQHLPTLFQARVYYFTRVRAAVILLFRRNSLRGFYSMMYKGINSVCRNVLLTF